MVKSEITLTAPALGTLTAQAPFSVVGTRKESMRAKKGMRSVALASVCDCASRLAKGRGGASEQEHMNAHTDGVG
ncbi:hypothetical protein FRC14_005887 [Serendipita sp. 396]|nr:hypothetical protein FRC14_005887 [Serendipita sp. 396]